MRSSKMQIAKRPYYKICFIDTLIRTRKLLKYQAEEYEIICSMDIFDLTAGYEEKQKKLCLAKVKINTIKHIGALSRGRRIGFDEQDLFVHTSGVSQEADEWTGASDQQTPWIL